MVQNASNIQTRFTENGSKELMKSVLNILASTYIPSLPSISSIKERYDEFSMCDIANWSALLSETGDFLVIICFSDIYKANISQDALKTSLDAVCRPIDQAAESGGKNIYVLFLNDIDMSIISIANLDSNYFE
ncbi:hypothetical protein N8446_08755, partial [Planktomarina temperata]|nr:hypothetical protein [Planktomarina temperata]